MKNMDKVKVFAAAHARNHAGVKIVLFLIRPKLYFKNCAVIKVPPYKNGALCEIFLKSQEGFDIHCETCAATGINSERCVMLRWYRIFKIKDG